MHLYPNTAPDKLRFDVIRERLAHHLASPLGRSRLDAMTPSGDRTAVQTELDRVGEMQDALRFDDRLPFDNVLDVRDTVRRLGPVGSFADPAELLDLQRVLATVRRLAAFFASRRTKYPNLHALAAPLTPLQFIEDEIGRVVDEQGNVRDTASDELRTLRRRRMQTEARLGEALNRALRNAIGQGWAVEEQPTIRNGRAVIPVRAEAKRKVQGFVQDVSATGQTVYIEPAACLDLNNELREIDADERREIERILRAVADGIRAERHALQTNLDTLGRLDLTIAKARLSNELEAHVPKLNDEGRIVIRKGRHPVLELHFRRQAEATGEPPRAVVPLDLQLGGDYHTLVITGPNAGGKSVAMKTVGLFALMLAHGLPLPTAPESEFAVFDQLFVDIGDQQSIEQDLSTFSSHLAHLRHILDAADRNTLVLIDEAGTGTDPAEGGALAQAALERLTERQARSIVTTHHGSLKAFAYDTPGVENGSMQFDQATLSPTYRFQPEIPGSSYAFEIAERMKLSPPVLERARTLVGGQKATLEDLIATFEQRVQDAEAAHREAEAELRKAKQERSSFEGRNRKLKEEKEAIRTQALEEAERIVAEANKRIERTIREIKEAAAEREATKEARSELEQFAQEVGRKTAKAKRKKRPKTAPVPAGASNGTLEVGDQVVVDDGASTAEIAEIKGKEAVVVTGGLRMRVKLNRLRKVAGRKQQEAHVRSTLSDADVLPTTLARTHVDLRGQRVEEALQEVTRLIDEAIAANFNHLEILHGKGTGALRLAIHDLLGARQEVLHFEEAPWNQGGAGVTLVELR